MSLTVLSGREAAAAARLIEAVVGSQPPGLPAPAQTAALAAFDRLLAAAPRLNRGALRAMLWAVELGPLVGRWRLPLRRLAPAQRAEYLDQLERLPAARPLRAVLALVKLAFYGEDEVMGRLGYDADAVVGRGRALRVAEARW